MPLLLLCGVVGRASADETLTRERVAELARQHAPLVRVAAARADEVRATRVGARLPTAPNPDVGLVVGPRFTSTRTIVDIVGTLVVPFDVSGAPTLRGQKAELATRVAAAHVDDARRAAAAEALDQFVIALGAEARVALETERTRLDEDLWRAAQARRRAGTTGDFELQLAAVMRADGLARLRRAEGVRDAALVGLRTRVGLGPAVGIVLSGELKTTPPLPLESLLARLSTRPDRVAATLAIDVADVDAALQRRLGVPAPRLSASGGRDNELFARFGVEMAVPVYQRNQTARAVAEAARVTASAERDLIATASESELRAAYATYVAAARAFEALDAAQAAMTDAEQLAKRAYELGRSTLPELVVARREAANARGAHLDAKLALARARLAVDAAAGVLP